MLILCKTPGCGALFNPDVRWCWGRHEGTSSTFNAAGLLPRGACPICRKVHEE